MSLEIWGYIFGGATIFALIVGVFSVYNGRRTRKDICEFIEKTNERTNELIKSQTEKLGELIKNETKGLSQILSKISEQIAGQK